MTSTGTGARSGGPADDRVRCRLLAMAAIDLERHHLVRADPVSVGPDVSARLTPDGTPSLRSSFELGRDSRSRGAVPVRRCWREVAARVAVEEAERLQCEPGVLARHHRPVLRPAEVGRANGVPQHDVLIDDRPVRGGPLRQPGAARVLVRHHSGAASRWAPDSCSSSVVRASNALPYGFAGPAGTATASTSYTAFGPRRQRRRRARPRRSRRPSAPGGGRRAAGGGRRAAGEVGHGEAQHVRSGTALRRTNGRDVRDCHRSFDEHAPSVPDPELRPPSREK